jgi:hypothetical protein
LAFSLDFGRWKKCPIVLIVSFIKSEVMVFNKALQRQWVWCAWFAAYQSALNLDSNWVKMSIGKISASYR